MTISKNTAYYIIGTVIVLLTISTLIIQGSKEQFTTEKKLLYPNFHSQKSNIQKIQIISDGQELILKKEKKGWVMPNDDNNPVRLTAITRLMNWIEMTKMVAYKTNNKNHFEKIGLLNPTLTQNKKRDGSGTRLMLFSTAQTPIIDIIIGDKLQAFKMHDLERFFVRNSFGRAYLVESTKIPVFDPFFYLSHTDGMPKIDNISSLSLFLRNKKEYQFSRLESEKDITFFPTTIPSKKRLIYPEIATDFIKAITSKLYPKGAVLVDYSEEFSPNRIEIKMRKGKNVVLNFRKMGNNIHYMLIIHDKLDPSGKIYAYHIDEKDYKGVLQPFSAFLTKDITAYNGS